MSDPTPSDPALLPAPGRYDAEAVAAHARTKDPGLPPETAVLLAREAGRHLQEGVEDAPDLARRLLADHREAGATAANVVAMAAWESVLGG